MQHAKDELAFLSDKKYLTFCARLPSSGAEKENLFNNQKLLNLIKTEQNSSLGLYNMTWATQARCQGSQRRFLDRRDIVILLYVADSSREKVLNV
ncbi:hypothetical protein pdam_00016381 [Pocillopora damicornis]|uniref:Uncharacterized protein n=1 Tax=Pocillopora damicornis TaxID=46731 RepID=A0A3M6V0D8_POCDA|nr:hypothetical protein pdam_00016381 [Pocillopora damicornis]